MLLVVSEIMRIKPKYIINNYARYIIIIYAVLYVMHTCFNNSIQSPYLFPYIYQCMIDD